MRICIPTESEDGAGATVSRHFGRAPFFSVVDTRSGAVEVEPNRHEGHGEGACDPVGQIRGLNPDALVVAGIGGHALGQLSAAGIPTYLTSRDTLGDVLDQVRSSGLGDVAEAGCGEHGRHHHHHEA